MAKLNLNARRKAHARRRFDERYGIKCDDALHKMLVDRIQRGNWGEAEHLMFISHRVTAWTVLVEAKYIPSAKEDQMIPVLYDKASKLIITALPPDCKEADHINAATVLDQEDVH